MLQQEVEKYNSCVLHSSSTIYTKPSKRATPAKRPSNLQTVETAARRSFPNRPRPPFSSPRAQQSLASPSPSPHSSSSSPSPSSRDQTRAPPQSAAAPLHPAPRQSSARQLQSSSRAACPGAPDRWRSYRCRGARARRRRASYLGSRRGLARPGWVAAGVEEARRLW